jgi:hypothetical protein
VVCGLKFRWLRDDTTITDLVGGVTSQGKDGPVSDGEETAEEVLVGREWRCSVSRTQDGRIGKGVIYFCFSGLVALSGVLGLVTSEWERVSGRLKFNVLVF